MGMTFTLHYLSLNHDKPFMITHDGGEERMFFTRDEIKALDALCKQAIVTMEPVRFSLKRGNHGSKGCRPSGTG